MTEVIAHAPTLREKYQQFLRSFNPGLPVSEEFRIDIRPGLARRIAARAILEPGCQQVILGGVGSGKTSELLSVEKHVEAEGLGFALVDVSLQTKLDSIKPGALLAMVGEALASVVESAGHGASDELEAVARRAKDFARGKTKLVQRSRDDDYYNYDDDLVPVRTPGRLTPPVAPLDPGLAEFRSNLEVLAKAVQAFVVAFDSLDRLRSVDSFWSLVDQDLRVLRELKISVVIVAPLITYFTPGRFLDERFDRVHPLWSIPPASPELVQLIRQRDNGMLPAEVAADLLKVSGGVLRDVISLARDAGEEAYLAGAEKIEAAHLQYAARELGQSYRRGLGKAQVETLHRVAAKRGFDLSNTLDRELLATRRIIEYSDQDFQIHPALLRELGWADA